MKRVGDKLVFFESELGDFDEVEVIPVGQVVVFRSFTPKHEIEVWGSGHLFVRRVRDGKHYCQFWKVVSGEVRVLVDLQGTDECSLCDKYYMIIGAWG
jgi:hypothetical protein